MSDLERARKLVALAAHADTPRHEAETAAVQACRIIQRHKLLEGGTEHTPLRAEVTITIHDPMLVITETKNTWRLARLTKATRHTGTRDFLTIPKDKVLSVTFLDESDSKVYGTSGRVTKAIVVNADWMRYAAKDSRR